MTARRRVVDDPDQTDAVTIEIDPTYQPGSPKPEQATAEDRFERAMRRLGDYWGQACASAWFTAFPRGTFAEIRRNWFRKEPTR